MKTILKIQLKTRLIFLMGTFAPDREYHLLWKPIRLNLLMLCCHSIVKNHQFKNNEDHNRHFKKGEKLEGFTYEHKIFSSSFFKFRKREKFKLMSWDARCIINDSFHYSVGKKCDHQLVFFHNMPLFFVLLNREVFIHVNVSFTE